MTAETWRKLESLYESLQSLPPAGRASVLEGLDSELRSRLEAMLVDPGTFLNRPAWEQEERFVATRTVVSPGSLFGPYRVERVIGSGGMGDVFRATDTRLGRAVALKTCRQEFSTRFQREARAIASLNHPRVCALYDVGPDYLIMELLEGQTLAERLRSGKLPLDQTLQIGEQIAEALAAAHAKGIVHRDIKPSNIMLTRTGVKVLDFGIARTSDTESLTGPYVLGTPAYMAPEQTEGKEAGPQADIYALGLVMYEMATGKRPAPDSPATELSPEHFAHVVARCLAPEPEERWQSAIDLRKELQWAAAYPPAVSSPPTGQGRRWFLVAAGIAGLGIGIMTGARWFSRSAPDRQVYRFSLAPPPNTEFLSAPNRQGLVLSADGRTLAFLGVREGQSRIWIRRLESQTAHEVAGTENASAPFWSPDGRSIGFFADGSLKRIDIDGGNLRVLADANAPRGGAWTPDGQILFSPNNVFNSPIYRVSAAGGETPVAFTRVDISGGQRYHGHPVLFGDGKRFLCRVYGNQPGLYVGALDNPSVPGMLVLRSGLSDEGAVRAGYNGSRFLIWNRDDTIVAQPWDDPSSPPTGDIVTLATSRDYRDLSFTISDTILVYGSGPSNLEIQMVDRTGKVESVIAHLDDVASATRSPDGSLIAARIRGGGVILIDARRGVTTPIPDMGSQSQPVSWSPDSTRLGTTRNGKLVIVSRSDGKQSVLPSDGISQLFLGWAPDGKSILYGQVTPAGTQTLWMGPADGSSPGRRLLNTQSDELHAAISADGKLLAYCTNESGRYEVYLRRLAGGVRTQVSSHGGKAPRWRLDGKELFYQGSDGSLTSVEVESSGDGVTLSPPKNLFPLPSHYVGGNSFDVSPDGQHFVVMARFRHQKREPLEVVVNWPALLTK